MARPGAVIGLADADRGGYLIYPENPVCGPVVRADGEAAHRRADRRAPAAPPAGTGGLPPLRGVGPRGVPRDDEEVRGFASFNASWFTTPGIVERVVENGWASRAELAAMSEAWLDWGEEPGAFFAGFWCEAIGWADTP